MVTFARVEFGMRKRELFSINLRQWSALVKRHEERQRRRDSMGEIMQAQIVAMIANTGFRSFKDPRQPKEFMPSHWGKADSQEPAKRLTKAARKSIVDETRAIMRRARLGKMA